MGSPCLHAKGFVITDLLGLKAKLQHPLATATTAKGKGTGSWVALGDSTLLLGLGFLCG